jgi:hypothetical protein
MASNCLAPAYLKLFYTANSHAHVLTLPVIPEVSEVNFNVLQYDDTPISQASALTALLPFLEALYPAGASFTGWEAYTQLNCSSPPIFRNAGTLTSHNGSNGGSSRAWGMATMTWKTALGGRGKMVLLEGCFGNDSIEPLAGDTGPFGDLSDFMMSDDGWVWARDNSRLSLALNYTTKTNDILRRKYIT